MRMTLLAIGTHGDVQPMLALAVALQHTGHHKVRFAAPDDFEALASEHGLDFFPLGLNARQLLGTGSLGEGMQSGRNTLIWVQQVLRAMRPTFERLAGNTWLACRDAQCIVYSTMGFGAYHVAEKTGAPAWWATPIPGLARTRDFPNAAFPLLRLGGGYNQLTHVLGEQVLMAFTRPFINRWRREKLDLSPLPPGIWPYKQLHGRPLPVLYSFSPNVLPRPPDWGEHLHITGYWLLEEAAGWQPPGDLLDFLDTGPPPVYVGFGSMAQHKPQATRLIVEEALTETGQRGVFAAGWSGLSSEGRGRLSKDLFVLDAIPHTWLFPRMAAVVHHGGCSTTGAGLRAGVPSIIVPHMGDQPFWGWRVAELGAGPQPIPRRRLTAERLAEAIQQAVTDREMRERAAALGKRMRAEDGVGMAIKLIEG